MTRRADVHEFWGWWLAGALLVSLVLIWATHVSPPPVSLPGGGVTVSPESSPGETSQTK